MVGPPPPSTLTAHGPWPGPGSSASAVLRTHRASICSGRQCAQHRRYMRMSARARQVQLPAHYARHGRWDLRETARQIRVGAAACSTRIRRSEYRRRRGQQVGASGAQGGLGPAAGRGRGTLARRRRRRRRQRGRQHRRGLQTRHAALRAASLHQRQVRAWTGLGSGAGRVRRLGEARAAVPGGRQAGLRSLSGARERMRSRQRAGPAGPLAGCCARAA